ncbi:hypothetical protein DSO57_1011959 [Entomophthora muscae]|uniref:Uncharacterized protein n=1 Tax=Entomophthora muscae TaxID=34485 RepID=A0ACC2SUW4_9FUNG|nr:hypothetical protein DSO57_1011959 [Entomophthora muscae]
MSNSQPLLCQFKTNSQVTKASVDALPTQTVFERISTHSNFSQAKIESVSKSTIFKYDKLPRKLCVNGFAEAVHLAYDQHLGLLLSPDHIFIAILQSLSIHINQDAEKHRQVLGLGHLTPGTKEEIDIRRDQFKLGDFDNDWQGVFPDFKDAIGAKVSKDVHTLLASDFSTSTPLSIAITSLSIMDIFKSFFEYSVTTMCGIPEIALLGTKEDWESVRSRTADLLSRFEGTDFWTPHLLPVLDQFVSAANGKPDSEFWTNLYKPEGGSGGPFISGWINVFFPYLQREDGFKQSSYVDWTFNPGPFSGLTYDAIPPGFTKTPFTWNYYHEKFPMDFIGGFLGAEKACNDFVTPSLAWAVVHDKKE